MAIITADQSRQARRELGLSQADVADATGLKRQYVSEFESGTSQRFTQPQLRKLRAFYEGKIDEARAAGDEIALTFGASQKASEGEPAGTIDKVPAKRFHFPVDDAVPDTTLAAVLSTIRSNDRRLADLLNAVAERESTLLGEGDFTGEVQQAFRDAFTLLATNYLMVRALGGWPEIGLSAAMDNPHSNTVLAALIDSMRDTFERAGIIGSPAAAADDGKGNEA